MSVPPRAEEAREFAEALRDTGFWFCGRCRSYIPASYWHRCDQDGTNSGPHGEVPA